MPITKVSLPGEIHKSWHLPESRNFSFLRQCFFSYSLKYNNASRKADSKNFLTHFIISMPKDYSSAKKKTFLFSKRQSTIKTESPGNNDLGAKNFPPPPPVALLTISRLLMNGQIFEFSIKFKSKIVCHGIFISFE